MRFFSPLFIVVIFLVGLLGQPHSTGWAQGDPLPGTARFVVPVSRSTYVAEEEPDTSYPSPDFLSPSFAHHLVSFLNFAFSRDVEC